MASESANVKNEKQYEALKDKGMSKERAAKIANAKDSSKHGGEESGKGSSSNRAAPLHRRRRPAAKAGRPPPRRPADPLRGQRGFLDGHRRVGRAAPAAGAVGSCRRRWRSTSSAVPER